MTSQTPPPEFRTAIADIVTAAMAYGAMLGINGRDRIEELLRADLSQSLGDALAPEVENLLDIRPSLAEAVYTAAQPTTPKDPS
jgi:hypothetical protein